MIKPPMAPHMGALYFNIVSLSNFTVAPLSALNIRCVFVGSIGSDCNPIRDVIFSCLTKTDIAIGLAMFCKQRSFGTPRTMHHTKSCLKLSFYRSIRIYRVDFEKI